MKGKPNPNAKLTLR